MASPDRAHGDDARPPTPRRVGVELEFGGITLDDATRCVVRALGGRARSDGDYRRRVEGTALGEFRVELDFELLQTLNERRRAEADAGVLAEISEDLLAAAAEPIVPVEVVSPPLAVDRLEATRTLTAMLRRAGAQGTRGSFLYAFGLHLNPELTRIEADEVLAHLRAYLCLYDWLVEQERVAWQRRLTPHIRAFPRAFVRHVVAARYAPSLTTLIDDYLEFNPERNRSLDLLPLFAHVDETRVRRTVDDPRIKPRPTFHYRLPNCEIDHPGWSILPAWGRWLAVEALAADRDRLDTVCDAYREHLDHPLDGLAERWSSRVRSWVDVP